MDFKSVLDYSQELFKHYATEEKAREQFLFAKALHNNEWFYKDVEQEFFTRVKAICGDDNHQSQKLAFRKVLLDSIKNMVMWQEFFKRDSTEDSKQIFSFMKDSFKGMTHEEFEKQSAYFQLYSEAMYSLVQCILNRFYDEAIENNYSVMLTKVWRLYYEQYFKSILAKINGTEFLGGESMSQLNTVVGKVEGSALNGDELVYDLEKI